MGGFRAKSRGGAPQPVAAKHGDGARLNPEISTSFRAPPRLAATRKRSVWRGVTIRCAHKNTPKKQAAG